MKRFSIFLLAGVLVAPLIAGSVPPKTGDMTLSYKLDLNGQTIKGYRMKLKVGKQTRLQAKSAPKNQNLFIEVIPSKVDSSTMRLAFIIGKIVKGKRKILSEPSIIVQSGMPAAMSVGSPIADLLDLAVTARF